MALLDKENGMFARFCDWMKFNPPYALSIKDWAKFGAKFKSEAPVRYYLVNTLPGYFLPLRIKFDRMVSWIRYRVVRYHIIDTGLKPGYYESDELMLNANFSILKDFVEVQKGWMYVVCSDKEKLTFAEKYIPYYRNLTFRRADLGIKYLEWEMECTEHETQADRAKEIFTLYDWWVNIRPNRQDIEMPDYDDQGYELSVLNEDFDTTATDYVEFEKKYREQEQLEESWKDEDTVMLIRLIKIREDLWT